MWRKMLSFWFLASLIAVLVVGLLGASALSAYTSAMPRAWLIAAIMFVTALPIDLGAVRQAAGAGRAISLALLLNMVAAPLLGKLTGAVLSHDFAIGLVVAAASPCTIASAAVWVRRGGGNDGIAVVVTLATTLASFIIIPFWTWLLLGDTAATKGFYSGLLTKLLLCVVLPVAAAQSLRKLAAVQQWASTTKQSLSFASQLGVLTMALVGAVASGVKLTEMENTIGWSDWLLVAGASAAVHVSLLLAGWKLSRAVGLGHPEALAVAISGSQKTLAVGVAIALEFGGLAIFPMIAYHMLQLVFDTVFVDHLNARRARA